jgi:TonB family protein
MAETEGSPRASNLWTSVLSVLVIVVAVLLGLALGWRGTILRGLRGGSQERAGAVPNGKTNRAGDAAGDQKTDQAATAQLVASARDDYGVPAAPSAATAAAPPEGGLLVTQNGKVIYRLPPSGPPTAAGTRARPATTEGSAEVSASRLIHRVEPQYPLDASTRHIQGLVRLDVQIGEEGAVHNITVVDGDPVLAGAAVQAVRQWRYRPYSKDGHAVEMQTRVTIRFTLPPA